jgi:hypothetical protein
MAQASWAIGERFSRKTRSEICEKEHMKRRVDWKVESVVTNHFFASFLGLREHHDQRGISG